MVLIEHADLGHRWELTTEQAHKINTYLEATRLFVECLKFAAVSDREGIQETLLLPPGAWSWPQPDGQQWWL